MTPEIKALIFYAYSLGGNTRDMARLTGIPHDDVADALFQVAHEYASEGFYSCHVGGNPTDKNPRRQL